MNDFLLDLWNDLREKRLWPVAALLLAGLIAVPVVLSKPTEDPPPASVASAPEQGPEVAKSLAALTVAEDEPGKGSSLDVFDPSNPFKPPKDIISNSDEPGGGDTAESTSGDGAVDMGAGGTGTDTGGGGGGGGETTPAPTDGKPQTVEYRYVIDVTFVNNGRKRKIKGMERLDVLPGQANPLLIFLGASKNGANAVFLVDSTLAAAGEGKCKPSDSECAFLYLGAGSEHELTNDQGDSYTLRVDQIRKVKVGDDASPAKGSKSSKQADDAPTASAALGSEPAARRFVPPLITDLVSVSGGSEELSDDGQIGR
jgi:hypothetical protein